MKVDFKTVIFGKPCQYASYMVSNVVSSINQYKESYNRVHYGKDGLCFHDFLMNWRDYLNPCEASNPTISDIVNCFIEHYKVVDCEALSITYNTITPGSRYLGIKNIVVDVYECSDRTTYIETRSGDIKDSSVVNIISQIKVNDITVSVDSSKETLWDKRCKIIETYDRLRETGQEPLDMLTDNIVNSIYMVVTPINNQYLSLFDGVDKWQLSRFAVGLKSDDAHTIIENLRMHRLAIKEIITVKDDACRETREAVIMYPIQISQDDLTAYTKPNPKALCTQCQEDKVISVEIVETPLEITELSSPAQFNIGEETIIKVGIQKEMYTIKLLIESLRREVPKDCCCVSETY